MTARLFLVSGILALVVVGGLGFIWTRQQPTMPTPGPYAGQQLSVVRGLTETEIDDLRNGRGMGFARAGEINGYPGPRHVLDLAGELALSSAQQAAMQSLFDHMNGEAVPLGNQYLTDYAQLEDAFRSGSITPESLDRFARQLGRVDGALRAVHLKYHVLAKPLLTTDQLTSYSRLRGYTDAAPAQSQSSRQMSIGLGCTVSSSERLQAQAPG